MLSYSFRPFFVQELPYGIQTNPPPPKKKKKKKSLHQNLTLQTPHAEFLNYKNFPESIK